MKPKIVCVLGMHRSGTSLLANILQELGVYLGKNDCLLSGIPLENPEGFYEHQFITNTHDEILKQLGRRWFNSFPLPEKWWKYDDVQPYAQAISDFINKEFADIDLWGWKDPRTCILLPMWLDIFHTLEVDLHFILPIRNPLDVAKSLNYRNGISIKHGIRLWFFYMINAIVYTKNHKRLFVSYDKLIQFPIKHINKITDWIGINHQVSAEVISKKVIKPALRHHESTIAELESESGQEIVRFYQLCLYQENYLKEPPQTLPVSRNLASYMFYAQLMELSKVENDEHGVNRLHVSNLEVITEDDQIETLNYSYRLPPGDNTITFLFHTQRFKSGIKSIRWIPTNTYPVLCLVEDITINNLRKQIRSEYGWRSFDGFDVFIDRTPAYKLRNDIQYLETIEIHAIIKSIPNMYLAHYKNAEQGILISQGKAYKIAKLLLKLKNKILPDEKFN